MKISIIEQPVLLTDERLATLLRRGQASDGEVRSFAESLRSTSPVFGALASGSVVTDEELESAVEAMRSTDPSTTAIFYRFLRSRRENPWLNPAGAGAPPF